MRKLNKIFSTFLVLIILLSTSVLAAETEYFVSKELVYESNRRVQLTSGFVEVLIGNTNFVQYQKDNEIVITPTPDEIREDEYGNMYAYFDLKGLRPEQKFKITIKRDCTVSTYEELIPARSDTDINGETEIYLGEREKIEATDPELVAKAKELTEEITTDYKKAQAIFEYINVNMTYDDSSAYANKGALSALKNMRGVCEEFTTLFVAMCRAVDVPSRAVTGYKVEENVSGDVVTGYTLINHVWAEIYLDEFGWVPVEPTVEYRVNEERRPYLDSFCKLETMDRIAVGLYNHEKFNRRMKAVNEISYKEEVVLKDELPPEKINQFTDIESVGWAKDAIQNLYAKGVVEGYSNETYGPNNNISRIEFICMLSRLLKSYDTQFEERGMVYYYPDYDETHWSKDEYDYLMRCYQSIEPDDIVSIGFNAITDVFGVGAFDMNKPITRGEVVALMDLFLEETDDYDASFPDIWDNPFTSSIIKAYTNGLINGYPDGTFKPDNPITRAEMAAILNRYIEARIYVL